jgi:cytochrome P450
MREYDPYAYEMHEDPYPTYAELRTHAPLYRNARLGLWALPRHAHVLAAFRDITRFSNRNGVSLDPASSHPRAHAMMSFLALDPPRHTRMRALVSRGFTPRRIAELEPRIREIATGHIDAFIANGRCDFIKDFAGKFPMDVISEMLGVPQTDRDQLRAWADIVVHREEGMTDVPPAGMEAAMHMLGYFGSSSPITAPTRATI